MERGGGALLGSAGVAVVRAVGDTVGGSVPLGSAEVVAPIVKFRVSSINYFLRCSCAAADTY